MQPGHETSCHATKHDHVAGLHCRDRPQAGAQDATCHGSHEPQAGTRHHDSSDLAPQAEGESGNQQGPPRPEKNHSQTVRCDPQLPQAEEGES